MRSIAAPDGGSLVEAIGSPSARSRRGFGIGVRACVLGVVFSTSVFAADVDKGWAIQFYRDSFTKDVFPIASVAETGATSPASLALVCAQSSVVFGAHMATMSGLGLIFPLDRNKGQPNRLTSSFRSGKAEATVDFRYDSGHTGVEFLASPADTKTLLSMFANDPKGEVAFRVTGVSQGFAPISKQGVFLAAGFDKALPIMTSYCQG